MDNVNSTVDYRGCILTDKVSRLWLESVTPRYYSEYIKFVVHPQTNRVFIGMDIHADCVEPGEDASEYYGGNIFFADGHIEYESTLNIYHNDTIGDYDGDPRVLRNPELIDRVNLVLFAWIPELDMSRK